MTYKRITDAELKVAAAKVRDSMIASLLSEEMSCSFSDDFLLKIEKISAIEKRKNKRQSIIRNIAAALIALFTAGVLFLAVNTEARAAVIDWIRELYSGGTIYWSKGAFVPEFTSYEPSWIPDGYEVVSDETLSSSRIILYQLGDDPMTGFSFDCSTGSNGGFSQVFADESEHEILPIDINGNAGELYKSRVEDEPSLLIWVDKETGILFSINSYLESEVMLHIAESVKIVK